MEGRILQRLLKTGLIAEIMAYRVLQRFMVDIILQR